MNEKRISPDRKKKLPLVGTTNVGTANAGTTNAGTAGDGTAHSGTTNAGTAGDGTAHSGTAETAAGKSLLIRALEVKGNGTSSRKAASPAKKASSAPKTDSARKTASSKKTASSPKKKTPVKVPSKATAKAKSAQPPAAQASVESPKTNPIMNPISEPALSPVSVPVSAPEEVLSTDLSTLDPILESGAGEISVPLCAENIRAFSKYARLLKEWNEKMNLTNITDDKGIALRHFVDSLTLVSFLEAEQKKSKRKSLSLIDVGTGAGFPGIPLKVALPWLQVTLLDSLRKRVGFLDAVCTELELSGIGTVHSRAEDAGRSKQFREKFDVATARAVAPLPILCEYCLPFVKVGGIFLAMKGNADREAEESTKAIVTLGGTIEDLRHFTLPGTDMNRSIIVIRKVRATPAKYPRQAGKPEKEPIV